MRYKLDYAKRKQCEMLHKALLVGDLNEKEWCREMGIADVPKMYGCYSTWRREQNVEKATRIRRTA